MKIKPKQELTNKRTFFLGETEYPWEQFREVFAAQLKGEPIPLPKLASDPSLTMSE
jgi:hypothetical protein